MNNNNPEVNISTGVNSLGSRGILERKFLNSFKAVNLMMPIRFYIRKAKDFLLKTQYLMYVKELVLKITWLSLYYISRGFIERLKNSKYIQKHKGSHSSQRLKILGFSDTQIYKEFNKTMNEYMHELSMCAREGRSMSNILHRINLQDRLLMNCYQKARGRKHYIDLDFDVPHSEKIEKILHNLKNVIEEDHNGRAFVIKTQGGYHVLISRDTEFDNFFNPPNIVSFYGEDMAKLLSQGASGKLENIGYEGIVNSNAMIPLPGTAMNNHTVRVLFKE